MPFGSINCPKEFALKVVVEDKRPSLKEIESKSLKDLLSSGWATNPLARPNFSEVRASLEIMIADFSASRRNKLEKLFRRSLSTPVHSSYIDCAPTETHARMPSYRRYHTELYGDKRDEISRNLCEHDDYNTTARSLPPRLVPSRLHVQRHVAPKPWKRWNKTAKSSLSARAVALRAAHLLMTNILGVSLPW